MRLIGVTTVAVCCLAAPLSAQGTLPVDAAESFDVTAVPGGDLELRLRELEESHRRLEEQYQNLLRSMPAGAFPTGMQTLPDNSGMSSGAGQSPQRVFGPELNLDDQPPDVRTDEPNYQSKSDSTHPLSKSYFKEGFKWETDDGEYSLNFHNETQLDVRAYGTAHSDPTNQFGFYIPRMRFIFNGRLTKPIEYNVSLNKGLGSLDLLDAYLNFNYDSRLQFRFGRYRAPFTYDWYALSNQFLPTVERSVFAVNYGFNRNFAAMLHGELFDERVDYALAAANGPRNSYFDQNADKDLLVYVNARPFMRSLSAPALQHLNLGGSATFGIEDQDPLPVSFRTSANATESAGTVEAAPSFLQLNGDVVERGLRRLWELHAAYYYKQLTLMAALDGGFNDYGRTGGTGNVRVPAHGWHAQFGYFLTGEELERRTFVTPLRPFDPCRGQRGPGAIELQARFDHFDVGREVFDAGLAARTLWTNRVNTIDAGVNWYWNPYIKIYFDWQHAMYGSPVVFRSGRSEGHSDLFWTRCQLNF